MDDEVRTRELLEYDSGGDADEDDVVEGIGPFIFDWKPQCGDINILPRMYANEISKITGTDLFVKVAEKRYGLINGDVQLARQKLSNIEPLLVQSNHISHPYLQLTQLGIDQKKHGVRINYG